MTPIAVYGSSNWNIYTGDRNGPAPLWNQWLRARPEMVIGWSPDQDHNLGVCKQVICYMDTYAIPTTNTVHPEWILTDSSQNKLYQPYNCVNGSCQAYAGDLTNPAFVANQMGVVQAIANAKYQGVFFDNANLGLKASDGTGKIIMPSGFTSEIWARAMANFFAEVRSSFPKLVIVMNSVWFDGAPELWVRNAIVSGTYYNIQRGYGDPNLSDYAKAQQLKFVDMVHSLGRNVIQMEDSQNPVGSSTMTLQEKVNWFNLGYKAGDLMIVPDLYPNDTGTGWSILNA